MLLAILHFVPHPAHNARLWWRGERSRKVASFEGPFRVFFSSKPAAFVPLRQRLLGQKASALACRPRALREMPGGSVESGG